MLYKPLFRIKKQNFPKMQILEMFTSGKRGDKHNEDGIFFSEDYAAVIDGSTSKVPLLFNGLTKGQKATQIVKEALACVKPQATLQEITENLTSAIKEAAPQLLEQKAAYRLTCSAAIFSHYNRTIWIIGDCQVRFNETNYTNRKIVDKVLEQIRSDINHYWIRQGKSIADIQKEGDPGRRCILNELQEQCEFQNDASSYNPFAYSVIDGTSINMSHILIIPIPQNINEIILASDGYPLLFNTLKDTENHLQEMLLTDPLCIDQNMQTKGIMQNGHSFDDRTFLRFTID